MTARSHVLSLTLADLDLFRLASAWFIDLERDERIEVSIPLPPRLGSDFSPHVAGGDFVVRTPVLRLAIRESPLATRLEVRIRLPFHRVDAEVIVAKPEGHESLNVLVPFSDDRFQLTSKHVARPARGLAIVDGRLYRFDDRNDGFGTLDFGRGVFPSHTRWNWSAASGVVVDQAVGWNLGAQWTDGTGVTENGLVVGGRLHKIGDDARFEFDRARPTLPWHIRTTSGSVDLELRPLHVKRVDALRRRAGANLVLAFGTFRGRVFTEDGSPIEIRDLVGFAEDFEARW